MYFKYPEHHTVQSNDKNNNPYIIGTKMESIPNTSQASILLEKQQEISATESSKVKVVATSKEAKAAIGMSSSSLSMESENKLLKSKIKPFTSILKIACRPHEEASPVEGAEAATVEKARYLISDEEISLLLADHGVGIPTAHARSMLTVARQETTVFGIRPVDLVAKKLIEEGYPTKPLLVKGKSANWGPQAGFICIEQGFSKKEGNEQAIKKLNDDVKKGIDEGTFASTPLLISLDRIMELEKELKLISIEKMRDGLLITAKANKEGQSQKGYRFLAIKKPDKDNKYEIQFEFNNDYFSSLEVLSELELNKPLIADYDLFFVAPRMKDFGTEDQRFTLDPSRIKLDSPPRPVSMTNLTGKVNSDDRRRRTKSECLRKDSLDSLSAEEMYLTRSRCFSYTSSTASPSRSFSRVQSIEMRVQVLQRSSSSGFITGRVQRLITAINNEINRGHGLDMVHHGDDAGNPASDMADNFPATIFMPRPLEAKIDNKVYSYNEITVLKNASEYAEFIKVLKQCDFHFTPHKHWVPIRRPSYDKAKAVFEQPKQ